MTDSPPGAVQLDIRLLFQMIGELYAENYMRKINANQGVQSESVGNGGISSQATDSSLSNGFMPEKVSRQTGSR